MVIVGLKDRGFVTKFCQSIIIMLANWIAPLKADCGDLIIYCCCFFVIVFFLLSVGYLSKSQKNFLDVSCLYFLQYLDLKFVLFDCFLLHENLFPKFVWFL